MTIYQIALKVIPLILIFSVQALSTGCTPSSGKTFTNSNQSSFNQNENMVKSIAYFIKVIKFENISNKKTSPVSYGSGISLFNHGGYCFILTSGHVVDRATEITLYQWQPTRISESTGGWNAEIVWANPDVDAAIIKYRVNENCQTPNVGRYDVPVGTYISIYSQIPVLAGYLGIGHVGAYLPVERVGMVIATDATSYRGSSGGGAFDSSGNLIGIVHAISQGAPSDEREVFQRTPSGPFLTYVVPITRIIAAYTASQASDDKWRSMYWEKNNNNMGGGGGG